MRVNENILTVDITVRRLNDGVLEFLFTDTCYRMTFCSRKWSLMKRPVKSTLNRLAKVQEAGGLLLLDDPPQKYLPVLLFIYFEFKKSDDYGVGCNDNVGNGSIIQRISSNCNDDDGDEVIWW